MRRIALLALSVVTVVGLLGIQPASATHGCTEADCNPVTVALLEGRGKVCTTSGLGSCTFHKDALWTGSTAVPQGLYCPTRGPGAGSVTAGGDPTGAPFVFNAGPGVAPPNSVCISNVGLDGCAFESRGQLGPGDPSGLGAYAFSSQGKGTSTFTAPPTDLGGAVSTIATFGWEQSAATILPLRGEVTSSTPAGGAGATVVGFTSSRSFQDGGNCGINADTPTTIFQVEGMIVTF
jgi:hypothetical protein